MPVLRITLKRSLIGYDRRQRRRVLSLGLRHPNQTVEHQDTPTIRGMIEKVKPLLEVQVVETGSDDKGAKR